MSKTTHPPTPGPWRASVDLFRPPKIWVHAPDSYAVCRVMTGHYHAEVAKANAHLIAAAPDLLAALKELLGCAAPFVGYADAGDKLNAARDKAANAILKAEGR